MQRLRNSRGRLTVYSTGLIGHEGTIYSPDGAIATRTDRLDCGHDRPAINGFSVPWGIVHTPEGRQEYCIPCCDLLELGALKQVPAITAYYSKGEITTWHGTHLMKVTGYTVYRHNFGGRFIAITAKDASGQLWHGRASFEWEMINLYKSKGG